ncbi:MAG: protein-disulfide reductase DsbD family protein [Bryobacteraceae bacterium]
MNRRASIPALAILAAGACAIPVAAQKLNPVQWRLTAEPDRVAPGARILARLTARIEPGWHLYSLAAPQPIISTSIRLAENPAISLVRIYQPKAHTTFDPNFGVNVDSYQDEAVFLLDVQTAPAAQPGPLELAATVRFQTCNDKMCLPPRRVAVTAAVTLDASAKTPAPPVAEGYTLFQPAAPGARPAAASSQGLLMFMLVAFGIGLAALFTPCCFPMIPIVLSFFLNKPAGSRARSVGDAALFWLGIMVLFTLLGLAATAVLGPFGVVQLGSNVWVNAFLALVFLAFALSLLGAFEMRLPSGLLTRLNRASQGGGIAGTLLMGLTFSLTSFACVGPFVGTLLAASVQSGGVRPLAGMVAFAAGLATPFFFLALFPSYLKRLPKSGGWMERVKVVMGFLILAAMFKYVSAVDQVMQWNLLTRERFLAAWIVLFGLAGLYLLGFVRLPGGESDERLGLGRLLTGAAFLALAISLAPGMFGARLGELDAYVPASANESGLQWMRNQYREALEAARNQNKQVLVSFTGYACTNCHWMKANMFTRPEVAAAMKEYVLVELYTDGTDAASAENQKLEETKFSTVAMPYYAILSPDERVVASFPGLTRDAGEFLRFLRAGMR